jgi:hypothetical protein
MTPHTRYIVKINRYDRFKFQRLFPDSEFIGYDDRCTKCKFKNVTGRMTEIEGIMYQNNIRLYEIQEDWY